MAFWLLGLVGVALLTAALAVLLAVRVPDSAPVAYSLVAHQAEEAGLNVLAASDSSPGATRIAATQVARELDSGSGSVSQIGAVNSEVEAGAGLDTMGKQVPARRLVLKIVMSSSSSTGVVEDRSMFERAQGVVLQLETDGGAGSSSSMGNIPELIGVDSKGHVQENNTEAQCGAAGDVDGRGVQRTAGDEIQQEFVKVLGEIASQGSSMGRLDSRSSEGSSKLRTVILNGVEIDEAGLQRLIASLPVTVSAAGVNNAGYVKPVHTSPQSEPAQVVPQTSSVGVMDVLEGTHVTGAGVTQGLHAEMKSGELDAEIGLLTGVKAEPSGLSESLQPLAVLDTLSDGLGCLRIIGAEATEDLKPTKDPTDRVSADVAAALAALSLDCADANDSVIAGDPTSSALSIPAVDGCVKQVPELDERNGSGPASEELDERQLMHATKSEGEEDDLEARRREKKKKKKKKQKAKSAKSMGATAAEIERKVIEKLTAEHVRALAEIEVGCSCKSARGASHMISCPYPFTSSGSMVQRKIKEQYDELVRSNAGRTLTLAQVCGACLLYLPFLQPSVRYSLYYPVLHPRMIVSM